MNKVKVISNIGFGALLLAMTIPLLSTLLHWPRFEPLSGAFEPVEKPKLSTNSWFEGRFQSEWESWYNDTLSTRVPLVRSKNQFLYSLFEETSTYVLIGREGQLFAYNYFPAFRGFNRKSNAHWRQVGKDLAWLKDTLAAHDIPLLFIIAPNKVRYMPEHLPDRFVKTAGDSSDQYSAMKILEEYHIPHLDLNSYFVSLKGQTEHSLFPNTGTHWTKYGALIAGDTLIRTLTGLLDTTLARITYLDEHAEAYQMDGDDELALHLNLWEVPKTEALSMPTTAFDTTGVWKPNAVIIGDSYYWGLKRSGVFPHALSPKHTFWYYNNTNFDEEYGDKPLDEIDRWAEILERDVVIILGTESNLNIMPYGIIEDLKPE